MIKPVSFRWSTELVARIDLRRGDVPRSVWVRRAVERALGEPPGGKGRAETAERAESALPPAPAEQPVKEWSTDAEHAEVYLSEAQLRERHGVEAVLPPDPKVGDEVPLRRVSPPKPISPRVPSPRPYVPSFQRGDK